MANAVAAAHALSVLQLLGRHLEPQPAAAIARDLGLPRSSVYHLLRVLTDTGFVVHLPEDRRYGLGVAAFELGSAYTRQAPLQRVGRPLLARLVDLTTHNAHLAVLHGRDVLYLLEERSPRRPSLVTDVGVRLPAQLTASGLAMLSALPSAQLRALFPSKDVFVRRHGSGPSSPAELRGRLQQVRSVGFATEDGWVTPGFASVAAVVVDHQDHPMAAVAVTYPASEVAADAQQQLAQQVLRTAAELSRRVAGRS
jgi:DNA-binding IclR family transcriptional regulator